MKKAVIIFLMITSFLLAFQFDMETKYGPPGSNHQELYTLDFGFPAIVSNQYCVFEYDAVLTDGILITHNTLRENVIQDRTVIYNESDMSFMENYEFT